MLKLIQLYTLNMQLIVCQLYLNKIVKKTTTKVTSSNFFHVYDTNWKYSQFHLFSILGSAVFFLILFYM